MPVPQCVLLTTGIQTQLYRVLRAGVCTSENLYGKTPEQTPWQAQHGPCLLPFPLVWPYVAVIGVFGLLIGPHPVEGPPLQRWVPGGCLVRHSFET